VGWGALDLPTKVLISKGRLNGIGEVKHTRNQGKGAFSNCWPKEIHQFGPVGATHRGQKKVIPFRGGRAHLRRKRSSSNATAPSHDIYQKNKGGN